MSYREPLPAAKVTLSRERVTRVVSPSEAGYIQAMRSQTTFLMNNLMKAIEHINTYTPEAIRYGLKPIYDESQRLVPVDTRTLKRSGFVEVRSGKTQHTVVIGYGRYGRPHYAAMVHERMDFRHAPPTQAKFLEQAISSKGGDFSRRVQLYMSKLIGGQ